ncbi:uncharacterized protein BDR25DRAFT_348062 [Lindgomyces ingoldianus]|uniref:Uncharacterized protein n=1 Tax=Lindgomyces ingoldianus TaxID=673940 RepID=A0ACB6REQ2_9PLEO|nr:uncharacterized protein BDR25DRAFT_348062 [Lindgomyces ingoldianus]KAF2477744.1 hypothetical protein BDR25DRAFT_348062 [Lindgomyces ingoldianus]
MKLIRMQAGISKRSVVVHQIHLFRSPKECRAGTFNLIILIGEGNWLHATASLASNLCDVGLESGSVFGGGTESEVRGSASPKENALGKHSPVPAVKDRFAAQQFKSATARLIRKLFVALNRSARIELHISIFKVSITLVEVKQAKLKWHWCGYYGLPRIPTVGANALCWSLVACITSESR